MSRNSIIILFVAFLMMGSIHAQSFRSIDISENRVEKATLLMKKKYDLNVDQYNAVFEVNKNLAQKVKPILLSDKTKMQKLLDIKPYAKEREKALMDIFNEEQQATYHTVIKERKAMLTAWLED